MSAPRHPVAGSLSPSGPFFTVHVDLVAGHIRLTGVLDRGTVHLFHEAISALLLAHHDAWVVDTTDLTGCDQIGVRAIGGAYRRALRHKRRMTLTGAPPRLQQSQALRLNQHRLNQHRLNQHLLASAFGAGAVPTSVPA
jgi:anti-anti-sigma regulatory factor